MRLIEAEVAFRNSDLTTAMAKINEARAFHGLSALTEPQPHPIGLEPDGVGLFRGGGL